MDGTNCMPLSDITQHHIDIQQVLAQKGVKVPRFAVRWIERLLHLDEINEAIYRHRDDMGVDFAQSFTLGNSPWDLHLQLDVVGAENIPLQGNPIVAGNHPLGGPDGLALMSVVGGRRRDILFPVNDFLLAIPELSPLFVPINKVGSVAGNVEALEQAFAGDNVLLYFPAGLCSRQQPDGNIRDLEWKPTVIKKAVKYHRDIVPFFYGAHNRQRFYTLARLRKRLGIRFGMEMALLPAETFAHRHKRHRLVFGKPIPYSTFDKSRTYREWAQWLQNVCYGLGEHAQWPSGRTTPDIQK